MILVVGSSGLLGGAIARALIAKRESVRILTRSSPAYQALIEMGAQSVVGDLKDRESLDAACAGVATVITTANAAMRLGAGDGSDTFESVDLVGTRNLIDAAAAAGVQQFIYTSAYAADANSPNALLSCKGRSEQALAASGMNYTILAPHLFMEVWIGMVIGTALQGGNPVTLVGQGNHRHSFVSVTDIVSVALAVVGNTAAFNQRVPIGGAQAPTWTEVVQRTAQVLGRDVPISYVPMGAPLPIPTGTWDLMYSTEMYEAVIPMEAVAARFGVTLTSLETVVRRMFNPGNES